jgi:BMFP domain-containing protein YqiC
MTDERRVEKIEDNVDNVRNDLSDIKESLRQIEREVRQDLTKVSMQVSDFTRMMEVFATRAEERDKRNSEMFLENKNAFERISKKIDVIEAKQADLVKAEVQTTIKIQFLEKIIYGSITTLVGLIVFVVENAISK